MHRGECRVGVTVWMCGRDACEPSIAAGMEVEGIDGDAMLANHVLWRVVAPASMVWMGQLTRGHPWEGLGETIQLDSVRFFMIGEAGCSTVTVCRMCWYPPHSLFHPGVTRSLFWKPAAARRSSPPPSAPRLLWALKKPPAVAAASALLLGSPRAAAPRGQPGLRKRRGADARDGAAPG